MAKRIRPLLVVLSLLTLVVSVALILAQGEESDEAWATRYFQEITTAPYTDWAFEPNVPEGYYVGTEPHGMILRTFVNEVVTKDLEGGNLPEGGFSSGAIIVKENHMPGETDLSGLEPQAPVPGFEGNLAALTFMVKVPGYNPEDGDWFWAKTTPDGAIDAAGRADGCIACHRLAAQQDYVFNLRAGD